MIRNLLVELLNINLRRRIFPFLFLSQGREKVIQSARKLDMSN